MLYDLPYRTRAALVVLLLCAVGTAGFFLGRVLAPQDSSGTKLVVNAYAVLKDKDAPKECRQAAERWVKLRADEDRRGREEGTETPPEVKRLLLESSAKLDRACGKQ